MSNYTMERRQKGFTLVEIAIVLVIIGLLLGGVLKGQELINNAKVKNFANDFRNTQLMIHGYQDKYRAIPGDDINANGHHGGTNAAVGTQGNGVIEGDWFDSDAVTTEAGLFWQHVRIAGLSTGPTDTTDKTAYFPRNVDGGRIGVESTSRGYITGLRGAYTVCSSAILGRHALQLDITLDDGNTASGSVQVVANESTDRPSAPIVTTAVRDNPDTPYIVCMGV